MIENKTIAILMTVHNRRATTLECLRHLFRNHVESYTYKVYLVDDGCTDGTAEAVAKEFPGVIIIKGDGNLYWNRGMIRSWEEAAKENPDFYLWLNDDTMLFPDAVKITTDSYLQGQEESIICGSTLAIDTETITYGGKKGGKLIEPNGKLQEAEWINGNCVLVPRIVKEKIGILDPFFAHSKGDWEYGIRASKNGVKLYVALSYIGRCDSHPSSLPKCYDSRYSLIERLGFLSHPLCPNPKETWYYCRKCLPLGILRAIAYIAITYFKTFFPPKKK